MTSTGPFQLKQSYDSVTVKGHLSQHHHLCRKGRMLQLPIGLSKHNKHLNPGFSALPSAKALQKNKKKQYQEGGRPPGDKGPHGHTGTAFELSMNIPTASH